ncbi:hypothetical protein ACIGHN_27710 [Acidovorax sp. NPDC077693]|uniref:hypothetical protein n=1 Tax=unclassified Acidovorax TaxID=2684926 RepID=UPI0037CB32C9
MIYLYGHYPTANFPQNLHATKNTFSILNVFYKYNSSSKFLQQKLFMQDFRLIIKTAVAVICFSGSLAFAQDTRLELVQRIATAQGVQDQIERQLEDQKASLQGYGQRMFDDLVAQSGGNATEAQKAAFDRFVQRCAQMFSAKELVAKWVENYGAQLSTSDLHKILKHYKSPIGKREVVANTVAIVAVSAWVNNESEVRMSALLAELVKDLQAVPEKR